MRSFVLVAAALPLLGAQADAQTPRNKLFRRAGAPRQVTLDLGTGTYVRGPVVHDRGGTTITDLSNVDVMDGSGFGWTSTDTGGGQCTWFSNASKGFGMNQGGFPPGTDLMSDVLFLYCSGALDTRSGGPGGSIELGFYEGYTIFGGAATTVASVVTLTGMPGSTVPGGFFGSQRCYGLNILFSPMVNFADDIFVGYSWHFMDRGTDGLYGATFPFLACVVSCSATSLFNGSAGGIGTATGMAEDGQGMLDAFDAFCTGAFPNGPTANTFSFTTGGPFAPPWAPTTRASMGMEIREAAALAATRSNFNNVGGPPNPDLLTATFPRLGTAWTVTFTRAGGGSGRFQVRVTRGRLSGNGLAAWYIPINYPWPAGTTGRRMIDGSWLASIPQGQAGPTPFSPQPVVPTLPYTAGTGSAAVLIPLDFNFCGLYFVCQARSGTGIQGTGNPRLSSAVECTIGTF